MIFYEKNICGMMFSKRELNGSAAEEASRTDEGEHLAGETFRQKDWEKDRILNLVLKCLVSTPIDRKDELHICV